MPKNYVIVAVASHMYLVKIIKSIVQLKLAMTIDHNHKNIKFMLLRLVVFDVARSMVEVLFLTKHSGYCGGSKIIFQPHYQTSTSPSLFGSYLVQSKTN
ncbi:hypothetical protein NC651_026723 [Populus alba x Populus x berolinensis]|nr:hypothetical protein NC651_026723 [Populus alba x Populus x berolinensis]